MRSHSTLPVSRSPALGLALMAMAAMACPATVQAATRTVTNCNDNGVGSLRAAMTGAASGDTIDLRSLTCSRIVLAGQIAIPQQDLILLGPGRFALTIDGNRADRVFAHSGTGRLFIDRVSIANGNREGPEYERGGCIDSLGTVELRRSRVHHCRVWVEDAIEGQTNGGGIIAPTVILDRSSVFSNIAGQKGHGGGVSSNTVTLYRSQVYGNVVQGQGGGIQAGTITATYSLVHGNDANLGGGIAAREVHLNKSTVSANRALPRPFLGTGESEGGGIYLYQFPLPPLRSTIVDSTISGNLAYEYSAGQLAGEVLIYNSTITDNLENAPDIIDTGVCQGPGALRAPTLRLESTIVSGNHCSLPGSLDIAPGTTVGGQRNLIGISAVTVPVDSIRVTDPRLAPLAENGGPTRTHLPLADSLAIDRGINLLNREFDQRGPGFPRVKGAGPDIGAVER
ncbi:MAG TPA: choice-of-anchor Q domain-containing protein [Lysobacter sp.]